MRQLLLLFPLALLAATGEGTPCPSLESPPREGTAPAQEAEPGTQEPTAQELEQERNAKALKRILHLAGGGKLRGIARLNLESGAWELRGEGRKFEALPVGAVSHATLEKDLLREAKKRLKGVRPENLDARALHAQWLMEQGLSREAFELYEILLRKDPDHGPTRRFVLAGPRPRTLTQLVTLEDGEARRKALLNYGSRTSALGREHTLRELSYLEDSETLHADLLQLLGSKKKQERSFATLGLRRLFRGESAQELLVHSVLDREEEVRRGAAFAIRDAGEPALLLPLLRALESRNVKVRTNATESLGNLGAIGRANALAPLVTHYANLTAVQTGGISAVPRSHIFVGTQFAYVQDFDVEVAQFQAVADPQINVLVEGSVLQARVIGVRDPLHLHERRVMRDALRKLSGADPGDKPSDWQEWLAENPVKRPASAPESGRTSTDAKN